MKKWIREYLPFTFAMLLLLAARSSLADHYIVPSGSMEPTLQPGDRVVVDKRAYGVRVPFTLVKVDEGEGPKRGDVVIFDSPADGTRLIKRLVALPGDMVEVKEGHAIVNGKPEVYGQHAVNLNLRSGGGPDMRPTTVPAGYVFVLGDARGNSRDSRFFGFVPESALYAKALRVYYRSGDGLVWLPL
jgi:signal peptidase I